MYITPCYFFIYLAYSDACLREHKEKIGMYIEPRRAMKHSLKALEHYRFIVITGEAGIGKTRFSLELMSQMQRKHWKFKALILTTNSQWNKLDFEKDYILFIDDALGKSNLHEEALQGWSTAFDPMLKRLQENHLFIIFALRNCITHLVKYRIYDYPLFRSLYTTNPPVDLSEKEFGLTPEEKSRMVYRFCRYHNVDVCVTLHEEQTPFECSNNGPICICRHTLNIIAKIDTSPGFPYLCEIFFADKNILKQGASFFHAQSARSYVKGQIDTLLIQGKYLHYALLVLLFLKEGFLKIGDIMKHKTELTTITGMIGGIIPQKITKVAVLNCFKDMMDIFIIPCENGHRMKHTVIYEAVLLSFGENFLEEFLEQVSKSVIFTYVRSNGYVAEDHEVIVQLDDDMTESLAKRLIDLYGSNKKEAYSDVYKHPSFQDKRLVDCFLDIIEDEEFFKDFLDSFVAGACKEGHDFLVSEIIRRNLSSHEFKFDIFLMALDYDLIHTFKLLMNDSNYKHSFLKSFYDESSGVELLMRTIFSGAKQCLKIMLSYLDVNNDLAHNDKLKVICAFIKKVKSSNAILNMVSYCSSPWDNDWSDILAKLTELCSCQKAITEYNFVDDIIFYAFIIGIPDTIIACKCLERVSSITLSSLRKWIYQFLNYNQDVLFRTLCTKMKSLHVQLDSNVAACLVITCVRSITTENMFLQFLNEFQCNFNYTINGNTILHACEESNYSDSTLLSLLQRPEGRLMFNSVCDKGRTPVQCRACYKTIRRMNKVGNRGHSSGGPRVRDVDWKDDTLVIYSSLRFASVLLGFSKKDIRSSSKDW